MGDEWVRLVLMRSKRSVKNSMDLPYNFAHGSNEGYIFLSGLRLVLMKSNLEDKSVGKIFNLRSNGV